MPYVRTFDRNQMMVTSWDGLVEKESIARIIDAFINSLDLQKFGVKEEAREGRPAYEPGGLFKLYIYGNRKGIRSSRKLADSCKTNIEVKWLMGGVGPDFRTISDFRKDNIACLKKIFKEFNKKIASALSFGYMSVDGSKFQANNAKDNNFTQSKLDDRIKWLNAHTEEYLRILDEMDQEEDLEDDALLTKEKIEERLKEAKQRLARYESYRKIMEESGASQMSLTDADAKLMKSKNGFMVSYNPQTAVDSETHLIRDFNMTNQATDHGLLYPTLEAIKAEDPESIIETVADKGYQKDEDIIACLENGIVPHVITEDGKDGYDLEISYEEAETDTTSTQSEELSKSLHAGKIPEAYKNYIEKIEVKEIRKRVAEETDNKNESVSPYGTQDQMIERAKEGYFVRDPERNLVYCPSGEILRQKSIKKNGNIRYANKNACKHCPNRNKCYKGKNDWKEIDFTKDNLEKPCQEWLKAENKTAEAKGRKTGKYRYEKIKVVRFFFKPDRNKTQNRLCLSEHPFGTIKRAMGAAYFLLRGEKKVEGEFALSCLGYNIERAKNLLGFDKLMGLMAES